MPDVQVRDKAYLLNGFSEAFFGNLGDIFTAKEKGKLHLGYIYIAKRK